MLDDAFWLALGWLLILEGLLPLVVPLWWRRTFSQLVRLRDGQLLFTYLHLAAEQKCTDALLKAGVTGVAYETVELPDRSLPLLAPMSEVAGRLAPQVGPTALSANRHLADYQALGVPVWPDTLPDQPGPLAGLLTGMTHAQTPWLASVPCDCPDFPADLVARLAAAAAEQQAATIDELGRYDYGWRDADHAGATARRGLTRRAPVRHAATD